MVAPVARSKEREENAATGAGRSVRNNVQVRIGYAMTPCSVSGAIVIGQHCYPPSHEICDGKVQ
jgi:hypothetical protein